MLTCFEINVVKIHTFAMTTLKRENMLVWALQMKLVHPKVLWLDLVLGHHGMSHLCVEMA